jgi:hypothetical protein
MARGDGPQCQGRAGLADATREPLGSAMKPRNVPVAIATRVRQAVKFTHRITRSQPLAPPQLIGTTRSGALTPVRAAKGVTDARLR